MRTFILVVISLSSISFSQNFWEGTNGPYGGTIYDIQYTQDDSILSGTENGIYISSGPVEDWSSFDQRLKYKTVTEIEKFQNGYLAILDYSVLVKTTASSLDTIYSSTDQPLTVAVNGNGKIFLGTNYDIYSSTDSGVSWVSLEDSAMNINFSKDIIFKNDTIIFYSEGNSIHRSYDEGLHWVEINQSFQNSPVGAIYLDTEGTLFAASGLGDLFKSVDNGDTWENIASISVTALLKDSSNFYAGTYQGIYKSTDGGYNWYYYSSGLTSGEVSCLSRYSGKIIAGTYGGGAYILNKNTNEWESKSAGMDATDIADLIIDSERNVFAGISGMGIQRQINNGLLNWEKANTGLGNYILFSLAISKYENSYDDIYTGTRSGIFKSTNKGQSWTYMNPPYSSDIYNLCVNNTGAVFINSISGVFRTTDEGISWDLMNSNNWSYVKYIACDPNETNVYLSDENDFYRTTNNGANWTVFPFSAGSAHRIRINSQGYIYVLRNYGEILRSVNSGNSFQNINNGLPSQYGFMHDIAFNSEGHIYLATGNGLYMSVDNGNSWYLVDGSNTSKDINVLAFNDEDRLYAGTFASGVFRSAELLTNLKETVNTSQNYFLYQNYPNPFNPSTRIRYSVQQTSKVTIKVFDVLGNEIEVLVNEEKPAGTYKITWNAADLPSGIYFYRIKAGEFVQTKKMVLLK